MTDQFHFSSADRPADEAFEAYRRLQGRGSEVVRTAGPFRAEVRGWRLDGMLLFERRLNGMIHRRGGGFLTDGYDYLSVHAVIDGDLHGDMAGRETAAGPGELLILDTSEPIVAEPRNAHLLSASLARRLFEPIIGEPAALHGRTVGPPHARIVIDYLSSLARWAPTARRTRPYAHGLVELLAGLLDESGAGGTEWAQLNRARRAAVLRFVADHLGDRGLSAAAIAEGTGLSRSTLYRLLRPQGGVARLVQSRRIAAVRGALARGSEASLAALAEEFGFAGEAHMSRLFKRAYGQSPGAFRRELRALGKDDPRAQRRRWEGWLAELA